MFFFFFFFDETNGKKSKREFDNAKWQNKANKGEWSELYALYKLLSEQNIYPINIDDKNVQRLRMPILSILRHTEQHLKSEYKIEEDGHVVINANGHNIIQIPKSKFDDYAPKLLEAIKKGAPKKNGNSDPSFELPDFDEFRKSTCCPNIKCYSKNLGKGEKDKSDLYIVIHDFVTGQTPIQGFSIKSEIGKPPTLLNATNLTNFKYKLSKNLSGEKVAQINSMVDKRGDADIKGRVRAILNQQVSLEFYTINPNAKGESVFLENLMLVDSMLPQIVSDLLVLSYSEDTRVLSTLTDKLSIINPIGFPMKTNKKQYEAKVRRFVTDIALGMVPSAPWEAAHQAYGMLVVNTKGDIDCYHIIYRKSLEDYLYKNLKFETPSASRYGFGKIETDPDGCQYFSLNIQLRFTK